MSDGAGKAYLGLDIGGTNVKYGLVEPHGAMLWGARVPTPAERPLPVAAITDIAAAALGRAASAGQVVAGLGVATPGRVDSSSGVVVEASNLRWKQAELGPALEESLGLPVRVLNDTNAAALGEYAADTGLPPAGDLICISIGTGVGAGLIMCGKLYTGHTFAAGELGHVVAVADGRQCACGGIGCLETIASGPGVVRTYQNMVEQAGEVPGAASVTLPDVVAAALAGHPAATEALSAAAVALGIQVANCGTLLDVWHFVIGGGVANIGWPLIPEIREVAARHLAPGKRARLRVRKSRMIDRAAIIGAVSYLRETSTYSAPFKEKNWL